MKEQAIQLMKDYFAGDMKRINHALRVLKHAEEIASQENITEKKMMDIIIYSAIFHDIGIHEAERKYNSSAGKYQEIEGPPIAKELLKKINIDEDILERVLYIVGNHHTLSKIDGIDFQILWEADLLVNLEEKELDYDFRHHSNWSKTFVTDAGKEKLKKILNMI